MLFGPVFWREVVLAPRREATYLTRSLYAGGLVLLVVTAWLVLSGTQLITDPGDFARFGAMLFQLLAPLQLTLLVFLSAMTVAASVSREKDRKTLVLLLMTRMTNRELVLGKLVAAMLSVASMLIASIPIFLLVVLLGGVSYTQVARVLLVTLGAVLACGSLGSLVALWREKTFQSLSTTLLLIVLWMGLWEAVGVGVWCSPWSAVIAASRPASDANLFRPILPFLLVSGTLTIALNLFAIAMVRVWNPSRETRQLTALEQDTWIREQADTLTVETPSITHNISDKIRHPWDNPVIWREVCTRAYGRRMWIVQGAYILFVAMTAWVLASTLQQHISVSAATIVGALVPIGLLSLILLNAQAVTSITGERDGGTFDLLLVSELTPKEFVYGKLGGIAWNMKWVLTLPLLVIGYLCWRDAVSLGSFVFAAIGLLTLDAFVILVGLHLGMNYTNTRQATAMSLGVVFFLFVGIACCMWMMVAFSGSFETQLQPFLAFMVGGGVGLYATLGGRNPSSAIALASFLLPIATFYALTSLLLGYWHLVFVAVVGAYGFTTMAMLIPAIAEFDVATGRTTAD